MAKLSHQCVPCPSPFPPPLSTAIHSCLYCHHCYFYFFTSLLCVAVIKYNFHAMASVEHPSLPLSFLPNTTKTLTLFLVSVLFFFFLPVFININELTKTNRVEPCHGSCKTRTHILEEISRIERGRESKSQCSKAIRLFFTSPTPCRPTC